MMRVICGIYEQSYGKVWINGIELGSWTSPGDFGGTRGRVTPAWWFDYMTQYGVLKMWSLDAEGAYIDGSSVSGTTLRDLDIVAGQPVTVRIGIKPDAEHPGGFNLFGRGFGNYPQDLMLRFHYAGPAQGNRGLDSIRAASAGQGGTT